MRLSIYPSIHPSIHLSIYPSIYLSSVTSTPHSLNHVKTSFDILTLRPRYHGSPKDKEVLLHYCDTITTPSSLTWIQ